MPVSRAVLDTPVAIRAAVERQVRSCKVVDMHTHLFSDPFGNLNLHGPDALLTYHYLQPEYFRALTVTDGTQVTAKTIGDFRSLSVSAKADMIYQKLFVENTPLSEACRGVLTTLSLLSQSLGNPDLKEYRRNIGSLSYAEMVEQVFRIANIDRVVMTNDPFVDAERAVWERGVAHDRRFMTALRVDPLFTNWQKASEVIGAAAADHEKICAFLNRWIDTMDPVYLAASLPPDFSYPSRQLTGNGHITDMLDKAVLPIAAISGLPVALMIGVKRGVNPALGLAGDGVGSAVIESVENLCRTYPDIRFLVTLLSDNNQRELAVAARKFPNLMPFGCWWFLNTPAEIERITTLRFELLGQTFVPQHSDARVLDQLLYKWAHSRVVITDVLAKQYLKLPEGTPITEADIQRDVSNLLRNNFLRFCGIPE